MLDRTPFFIYIIILKQRYTVRLNATYRTFHSAPNKCCSCAALCTSNETDTNMSYGFERSMILGSWDDIIIY